jgi:hypothetical protein
VEVPPSPKSQLQLVGDPVLVSVKLTVSGADPAVGVATKLAVGAAGWVTVIVRVAVDCPCVFEAVNVAVNVPALV